MRMMMIVIIMMLTRIDVDRHDFHPDDAWVFSWQIDEQILGVGCMTFQNFFLQELPNEGGGAFAYIELCSFLDVRSLGFIYGSSGPLFGRSGPPFGRLGLWVHFLAFRIWTLGGPFLDVCGPFLDVRGLFFGRLGPLFGHLGPLFKRLGPLFRPFWGPFLDTRGPFLDVWGPNWGEGGGQCSMLCINFFGWLTGLPTYCYINALTQRGTWLSSSMKYPLSPNWRIRNSQGLEEATADAWQLYPSSWKISETFAAERALLALRVKNL